MAGRHERECRAEVRALRGPRHLSLEHQSYSNGEQEEERKGRLTASLAHVFNKVQKTDTACHTCCSRDLTQNFKVVLCQSTTSDYCVLEL